MQLARENGWGSEQISTFHHNLWFTVFARTVVASPKFRLCPAVLIVRGRLMLRARFRLGRNLSRSIVARVGKFLGVRKRGRRGMVRNSDQRPAIMRERFSHRSIWFHITLPAMKPLANTRWWLGVRVPLASPFVDAHGPRVRNGGDAIVLDGNQRFQRPRPKRHTTTDRSQWIMHHTDDVNLKGDRILQIPT